VTEPRDRSDETPDSWRAVEELFDGALPLGPLERREFLDRRCHDHALRRQVESLLAASACTPPFLEHAAAEFAGPALEDLDDGPSSVGAVGERVGPYRLIAPAGYGGMSVVYLAERDDGVHSGRVAVKVLRRADGSRDLARRFATERRILGSLTHPNIARILDGGVTEAGWPYLVMEFVDGDPIHVHCARQASDLNTRLRLFLEICDAVQHAHERLVVHRDLKPSNVLVDREGRVRLLDFGIAKLLAPGSDELLTGAGVRLMTPEYAAPEQVRGGTITTATDVYALGVMLYELLSGERPYDLEGRSPSEMESIVCEDDPPPPSARGTRGARAPEEPNASTTTTAVLESVRRQARGDLDTICLKALSKSPDRRYGSAREIADDIRRYLGGHPVLARPTTVAYRMGKFVRRNRTGFSLAGFAFVLLAAFAIGMTRQQMVTARAHERAASEAERANLVSAFLVSLFEASDPYAGAADTMTTVELLDRGMQRMESASNDPAVVAALVSTMGQANIGLGRYEHAEALFRRAVAMSEASDGARSPAAAAAWGGLGRTLQAMGNYAGADSALTRSLEIARAALGENDPATVDALNNLGLLRADQGDYKAAVEAQREVYSRRVEQLETPHPKIAESLSNLGYYHRRLGDFPRAESLYRESIEMKRALLGDDHPGLAKTLDNLGVVLGLQERYAEAEPVFLETVAINERRLGQSHPELATSYNNLAMLKSRMNDHASAVEYGLKALEIRRRALGETHPLTAGSLANLATSYEKLGRLDDAIAHASRALAIERATLSDNHPDLATTLGDLGYYHYKRGDYREAERFHSDALAARRKAFGDDHIDVAASLRGLALVSREAGDLVAARSRIEGALAICRRRLGEDHSRTAECLDILGVVEHRAGNYAAADSLLRAALAIRVERLGANNPLIEESRSHIRDNDVARRGAGTAK